MYFDARDYDKVDCPLSSLKKLIGMQTNLPVISLEIISKEDEIARYQEKFIKSLRERATGHSIIEVGRQRASFPIDAYFIEELNIWFATDKLPNRYWNVFGLEPRQRPAVNSIIVEINFPFSGIKLNMGGVFIGDAGRVLVCHTGKVGGGRPKIGKTGFWKNFSGKCISLEGKKFAVIGELDSDRLPEMIRDFVKEVNRIKNLLRSSK